MRNKNLSKNYEYFKSECKKWIDRFGLKDYEISFHLGCDKENNADVIPGDLRDRWCKIEFSAIHPMNNKYIRRVAFHEICEILLNRFEDLAKKRFVCDDEITEERHAVIRRLENAFIGSL